MKNSLIKLLLPLFIFLLIAETVSAIPAFGRKYNIDMETKVIDTVYYRIPFMQYLSVGPGYVGSVVKFQVLESVF